MKVLLFLDLWSSSVQSNEKHFSCLTYFIHQVMTHLYFCYPWGWLVTCSFRFINLFLANFTNSSGNKSIDLHFYEWNIDWKVIFSICFLWKEYIIIKKAQINTWKIANLILKVFPWSNHLYYLFLNWNTGILEVCFFIINW